MKKPASMLVVTIHNILAFHAYYHYYLYRCYKYYTFKMIEAIQLNNPYSGKFFPHSARSHWLLRGHMTSNDEAVFRKFTGRAIFQKSIVRG